MQKIIAFLFSIALITVLLISFAKTNSQASSSLISWVELGIGGSTLARVATASDCPAILLDGQSTKMDIHAQPSADFPVRVCEKIIPKNTTLVSVNGQDLPLPKSNPQKIIVIGDTGCRLKSGVAPQACNNPQEWPFAQIAESAAAWQPDLVIHVGDYYYREQSCPEGDNGCAGSPWGDNWQTWQAELFTPAATLMKVAPWIVIRGNHELCNRGGKGWFHLLEPSSYSDNCTDFTEPYGILFDNLQLVMFDSAKAEDDKIKEMQVTKYQGQLPQLTDLIGENTWLLTHRPLWGFIAEDSNRLNTLNVTLQMVFRNQLPAGIKLVLSGHVHLFEQLSFVEERPSQIIVGNSGTSLDQSIDTRITGLEIAQAKIKDGETIARFGYMTLEAAENGWLGSLQDVQGNRLAHCMLKSTNSLCVLKR